MSQLRAPLLEERARDELAARVDPDLLEDRLEVVLYRPRRQVQAGRDGVGGQPARDEPGHLPLSLGETVRVREERRELTRTRGLDITATWAPGPVCEHRGTHGQPTARPGPHARGRSGHRTATPPPWSALGPRLPLP